MAHHYFTAIFPQVSGLCCQNNILWSWYCGPSCNHTNNYVSIKGVAKSQSLLGRQDTERIDILMHMLKNFVWDNIKEQKKYPSDLFSPWSWTSVLMMLCYTCHSITLPFLLGEDGIQRDDHLPAFLASWVCLSRVAFLCFLFPSLLNRIHWYFN